MYIRKEIEKNRYQQMEKKSMKKLILSENNRAKMFDLLALKYRMVKKNVHTRTASECLCINFVQHCLSCDTAVGREKSI